MQPEERSALLAQADALEASARSIRALANASETSSPASRLISRSELLDRLSISSPTLRKLETAGAIPFVPVGDSRRYDAAAVLEALANAPKAEASNVVRLTRAGGRR